MSETSSLNFKGVRRPEPPPLALGLDEWRNPLPRDLPSPIAHQPHPERRSDKSRANNAYIYWTEIESGQISSSICTPPESVPATSIRARRNGNRSSQFEDIT
ncbi:hypothetical protein DdX_04175 [Ditylenchus destructor]|uniref:Uncharacterized protein n=1 Tax=Ditylenchus destructor TaxID=166010 RepID=A0AAD4N7U1_9BILA|nr:hypothetical protein DdX_04175 [Ditylenchus destructor]